MNRLEKELQELCDNSIELFNTGNYEGVAKLYAEETQFLAPGFSRITTRDGVKEFWKSTFNAGYRFQKVETIEIRMRGDMAYWLFNWIMTNPNKNGDITTQTGKNVLIWEKTSLGWLVCLDSWNSPS